MNDCELEMGTAKKGSLFSRFIRPLEQVVSPESSRCCSRELANLFPCTANTLGILENWLDEPHFWNAKQLLLNKRGAAPRENIQCPVDFVNTLFALLGVN